jgi:DsbC/DsbD-like thiol-disulfide interchange protein
MRAPVLREKAVLRDDAPLQAALIRFAFSQVTAWDKREAMRLLACLNLVLLTSVPAFAGATAWQEVTPGVELRLISSDVKAADGTTLIGLELDMPADYRTYWREPGESGIPTQLDIAGSTGISDPQFEWPFPETEITGGLLDYVYRGPTVLPVRLKASGSTAMLDGAVVMGVCSEVCVPVQAKFSLPIHFGKADPAELIRLKEAEARVPIEWSDAQPAFGAVFFDPTAPGLRLTLASGKVDTGSVLALTSDPTVIFGTPQKSPDGRSLLLPLRGQPRGTEWTRDPVDLSFMTRDGPYRVSVHLAQSS